MSVTISPELAKVQYWQEIKDYVNRRMTEEGWEGSIFIRPMTSEEENKLRESGSNVFVASCEGGTVELAVGMGKYLEFADLVKLEQKVCTGNDSSVLMHLWIAQMACIGQNLGGCDS
jgi:hypothetical protein